MRGGELAADDADDASRGQAKEQEQNPGINGEEQDEEAAEVEAEDTRRSPGSRRQKRTVGRHPG